MTARNLLACLFLALAATAAPALAQDEAADADADTAPFNASVVNREARLDRLFDRLATAETAEDAKRFETSIESLWSQSGSTTADLLTARAIDLAGTNDQDGALKLLDTALETKPDYAEGRNKRATLFFLRGDYPSAMSAIYETLKLEPRHYGAWAGLGKILEQSGDNPKALGAYRRALAIHPYLEGLKEEADELEIKLKGEKL